MSKYYCPCCGYQTLTELPGNYEICEICFWEDDPVQLAQLDLVGGANHVSLRQARQNFEQFGASEQRVLAFVRRPTTADKRQSQF